MRISPKVKAEYLQEWSSQISKGDRLYEVTNMAGYKDASDYFENEINSMLRGNDPDISYIRGIQRVFDYFESGLDMSNRAHEEIKKYGQQP